jgi:hypothetical protein
MLLEVTDFHNADRLFSGPLASAWAEIQSVLAAALVHLKESDQAGIQGNLIFDPVGTNLAIKQGLELLQWRANVPIPREFSFLGTGVDFVKSGVLVESQFSNYPFLLNNIVRAELLFKSQTRLGANPIRAMVIVTKAHLFPASNSTLYYEQAVNQVRELARHNVVAVPIRLVGLFPPQGRTEAVFTNYHNPRYSRTVIEQREREVMISSGRTANSRARIVFA